MTAIFTTSDFPQTCDALVDRPAAKFEENLRVLNHCIAAGEIRGKTAYADLRQSLTRALETAYTKRISTPFFYAGAYASQPEELRDLGHLSSGFGSVKKAIKVCEKFGAKSGCATAILALLGEWVPVIEALNSLKDKVVLGRSVSGVEKPAPQAIPVTKTSMAVSEALEAYKPALVADYQAFVRRQFLVGVERFGPALKGASSQSVSDGEKKVKNGWRRVYLTYIAPVLVAAVEGESRSIDEVRLHAVAAEYADAVAASLREKIMNKAGELDSPVIEHISGMAFRISGTKVGKSILIRQSTKLVQNSLGTIFNQFPALIYIDGKFTPEIAYKRLLGGVSSTKLAVVHWEALVYGKKSKACAGSRQAVANFSGSVTTAPSDVTCERCMKIVADLKIRGKIQ